MSNEYDKHRIEMLQPHVVPAQPGFRGAALYLDGELTDTTTANEITVIYDPIIAWLIRPVLAGRGTREERMDEPEVIPIFIVGPPEERPYIVDPTGQFTTYSLTFPNERKAREAWLKTERVKAGLAQEDRDGA